jgi:nucleoside-diphosphate-sugar epimerase
LLDVSRLEAFGWQAAIPLEQGVRQAYEWMADHWDQLLAGEGGKE